LDRWQYQISRGQQVCCTITVFRNILIKKTSSSHWVLLKLSRSSPVKCYGPVIGNMWGTVLRARSSNQYFNTFTVGSYPDVNCINTNHNENRHMILKKIMFSFIYYVSFLCCEIYWCNRRQDTVNHKCPSMFIRQSCWSPLVLCFKFNINFLVPKSLSNFILA